MQLLSQPGTGLLSPASPPRRGSEEVPCSIGNCLGSDQSFPDSPPPPPTPAAYHLPPTPRPAVTVLQDSPSFQNCLSVSIATKNVGGKQKCWTATSVGAGRRRWNVGLSGGCRMRWREHSGGKRGGWGQVRGPQKREGQGGSGERCIGKQKSLWLEK